MVFAQHTQPVLLTHLFELKAEYLIQKFRFYGLVLIYFCSYFPYLFKCEQSHTVHHLSIFFIVNFVFDLGLGQSWHLPYAF